MDKFLYEKIIEEFGKRTISEIEIPKYIADNLNDRFELRPYQVEAFQRFICYFEKDFDFKEIPINLLFNMATGSGKTLIMAGLILYLYEKGYRNFLFFVNSTNIIEKTKDNFLNPSSSKFLFKDTIYFDNKRVNVVSVDNFEGLNQRDISIYFTTIQKLHSDLTEEKENSIAYDDFKNKKTVLIADEAHHINVTTKSKNKKIPKEQMLLTESWENTVEKIFRSNAENLLLEFTATVEYDNSDIVNKYKNKIIYHYDLKQFRNDGYSKDVYIVKSKFDDHDNKNDEKYRIIQALILSQYKQEVAAKHRINLKPVILFKAQRTIDQSKENEKMFYEIIENLSEKDINVVRNNSKNIDVVKRAFDFFDNNAISSQQLVQRLKKEFDKTKCLSVNNKEEKEKYQMLVNSLEDKNNKIRAIFVVQKLNEGWDVLNLFDIVRCYTTRDSKGGKPGKTTISEAQLIGRGARYFPFTVESYENKFQRKFDNDLSNELRVLEELHYHSINDSKYISEIRTALINEGMIDDREVERQLSLKESFKETDFYKKGNIYLNKRIKNDYKYVDSFEKLGVRKKNYTFTISNARGASTAVFTNEDVSKSDDKGEIKKDIKISDIPRNIIQNALARNVFFCFGNIRNYIPSLSSIDGFIKSEKYLGGLEITLKGSKRYSKEDLFMAMNELLKEIKKEIRQNEIEFKGTKDFYIHSINNIFHDKTLKVKENTERANGDEDYLKDKDWYVFNANYGTSEEKALVRMMERQINVLKKKEFDNIYLIRNERHFKIYNFSYGRAFEPDFVMFLRKKNGNLLTYQIFIEPKGKHLKEHDKWKEKFLKEIKNNFKDKVIEFNKNTKYKLIGLPFYNQQDENEFKKIFYESLNLEKK